jgi:hypothetical protein
MTQSGHRPFPGSGGHISPSVNTASAYRDCKRINIELVVQIAPTLIYTCRFPDFALRVSTIC